MAYPLKVEIAEEIYFALQRTAEHIGQTPEMLAAQWLTDDVRRWLDDPLEPFIGAFQSNIPDWAERHDEYLSRALLEEESQPDPTHGMPLITLSKPVSFDC